MKNKNLFLFLIISIFVFSCAEKSKSDNSTALGALSIINGCGTIAETVSSIGSTSRTQFDFSNCNNPSALSGFTVSNISSGLRGSSTSSKIASTGTYGSSDYKTSIEVTYVLSSTTSNLDIIAMGSGTGVELSGPGFRVSPTDVKYLTTLGIASAFGTGSTPASTVGSSATLCLEVHQEGAGSHIFGWAGACSAVTDRGSYTFEQEDVAGTISDRKIGFVLNNVLLTKIIVSNGALGTAGSILSF